SHHAAPSSEKPAAAAAGGPGAARGGGAPVMASRGGQCTQGKLSQVSPSRDRNSTSPRVTLVTQSSLTETPRAQGRHQLAKLFAESLHAPARPGTIAFTERSSLPNLEKMMRRIAATIAVASVATTVAMAGGAPAFAAHRASGTTTASYYLSLGDSLAQGVQ